MVWGACIQCMQNPHLWAMHTVRKLPTYVSGNVALLGDTVGYNSVLNQSSRHELTYKHRHTL